MLELEEEQILSWQDKMRAAIQAAAVELVEETSQIAERYERLQRTDSSEWTEEELNAEVDRVMRMARKEFGAQGSGWLTDDWSDYIHEQAVPKRSEAQRRLIAGMNKWLKEQEEQDQSIMPLDELVYNLVMGIYDIDLGGAPNLRTDIECEVSPGTPGEAWQRRIWLARIRLGEMLLGDFEDPALSDLIRAYDNLMEHIARKMFEYGRQLGRARGRCRHGGIRART